MPIDSQDFDDEERNGRSLKERGLDTHHRLTAADLSSYSRLPIRIGVILYRYLILLLDGVKRTELTRRAAALTYTTILSIFPLLAIISFTASFYYDEAKEDKFITWIVDQYIPVVETDALVYPATAESMEQLNRSQQLKQNFVNLFTSVSTTFRDSTAGFGVFGFIGLLVTCGILYYSIESVVNLTWRSSHQVRWTHTLTNFFTMLVFAPIVIGLSIAGSGLAVSILSAEKEQQALQQAVPTIETTADGTEQVVVMEHPDANAEHVPIKSPKDANLVLRFFRWVAQTLGVTSYIVPILINSIILAVAFTFIPRAKVYFGYAFMGAFIAAALWEFARYQFISYIYMSTVNRTLTDVLGISVIFLIWLYITWLILLLGILISYCAQNFQALWQERITSQQTLLDGRLLVTLMLILAAKFESKSGGGMSDHDLRKRLGIDQDDFYTIVGRLIRAGYVSTLEDDAYQIARPPSDTRIHDILSLGCDLETLPISLRSKGNLPQILSAFQKRSLDFEGDKTLLQLLMETRDPDKTISNEAAKRSVAG